MSNPPVMRMCYFVLEAFRLYAASENYNREAEKDVCNRINDMLLSYQIASTDDILQANPHVLKVLTQVLSRSVSVVECKIKNIRLVTHSLYALHTVMALTKHNEDHRHRFADVRKMDVWNIMILVMGVLEALKAVHKSDTSDLEAAGCASFASYRRLVLIFLMNESVAFEAKSFESNADSTELKGPYLAQIIQSCLYFSKHPSKLLALESLGCLSVILDAIEDSDEWRTYFPGIFSGLHIICMAGYKR